MKFGIIPEVVDSLLLEQIVILDEKRFYESVVNHAFSSMHIMPRKISLIFKRQQFIINKHRRIAGNKFAFVPRRLIAVKIKSKINFNLDG
jgi:hypothetical protein